MTYTKDHRSVYALTVHIVFVTKYRKKVINLEIMNRLKEVFGQTLDKWRCELTEFNGEADHCHLLVSFRPSVELSKLIANLKTVSSRLIQKEYPQLSKEYFFGKKVFWSRSYFVATCGGVTIEHLKEYVEKQNSPIC